MDTDLTNSNSILLIEDDSQDLEATLAALAEHNHASQIVVIGDGALALDYLYRRGAYSTRPVGNPTLVLLDHEMPKVNELEVLKSIKCDAELKLIPTVVFSPSREKSDLIERYKHGVKAYAVKPMAFADFIEVVKQVGIFWTTNNGPPPSIESLESQSPKRVVSQSKEVPASPPWRILVVDDDPILRKFCTQALTHAGYNVDSVVDGAAGWEALQSIRYDVVITDNTMPKVTGCEMVKLLRGQDTTLPVIMTTGAIPGSEPDGGSLGVNVNLLKPFTIAELVDTVRSVLAPSPCRKTSLLSAPDGLPEERANRPMANSVAAIPAGKSRGLDSRKAPHPGSSLAL